MLIVAGSGSVFSCASVPPPRVKQALRNIVEYNTGLGRCGNSFAAGVLTESGLGAKLARVAGTGSPLEGWFNPVILERAARLSAA